MNLQTIFCNKFSLLALGLGLLAAGCKKSLTGEIEDDSVNRSFTPANFSVSTVKDSAKFRWNAPLYTGSDATYALEISTDSLFATVDYTTTADTTAAVVLDSHLKLNTPYFARVRVAEYKGKQPSSYIAAARSFRLNGQQFFKVLRDFEVTPTSALLHWATGAPTAGLTHMVLINGKDSVKTALGGAEVSAGQKALAGLLPDTRYTVQLLAGSKSKGLLTFTTPATVSFTTVLSPSDNLATAITNAANGDVIGLNPGTYNLSGITYVVQKRIALRSVSGNPADTKVLTREINLQGDSAGITLAGIEFNGNYSGTSYGAQFLQLVGKDSAKQVTAFNNILIDNCIIHDFSRCVIRGNNGGVANDHKIGSITINNAQLYNIDQANTAGYYNFSLEKLQLAAFSLTKSTLYKLGQGLINMSTNLSTTTGIVPAVTIDYCTFNSFGGGSGKYAFIDANANKVVFHFNNSIVANTPISGSLQAAAFRASNTGNVLSFSNNNYFKLQVAPGGAALNLTGLAQANDISVDLGWTAATTGFGLATLPADHPVFAASMAGGAVGDPRWAY
ncbi:DUF4957 domain-containing protein [Paraflavisolibacter sp. H34]|uniref:DUF4957 domain-containing protein n=1 Tax=Huijunlia imazamoxiresistens TaxID=3127457 RepID=UPI003018000C